MEGERKGVTVMFSDVSGFTAMSEKLDPEEVHAIMDRAFEVILNEVHRYEGMINQFLGDGVMALFGVPVATMVTPIRRSGPPSRSRLGSHPWPTKCAGCTGLSSACA